MSAGIARGAAWMVLFRLCDRGLGLISTLVLARLLVPADFGLVAMAMAVIAIVEVATSFGFELALIQRPTLERAHYDSGWTLSALLGAVCAGVVSLAAAPAAAFYDEPRLVAVMLALSAGCLIGGLTSVGVVDFRRSMDFRREFAFLAGRRLAGFVATIACAFALRSYWALVVGTLVSRGVGVALSFAMHEYRARFSLEKAAELLSFSAWNLATNALIVAIVRAPHIFIGRLHGNSALGYFALAYDVATMPVTELASPINRAVLPGYARLASSTAELRKTFLDVGSVVGAVAIPAAVGIGALAEPITRVLLGPAWLAVVPLLQVLAASAAIVAIQTQNGIAQIALGSPRTNAMASLVRLIVLLPSSYFLGSALGVIGVAYAELLAAMAGLLASYPYVFRRLGLSVTDCVAQFWRPVVAATGMGLVLLQLQAGSWATSLTTQATSLILAVGAGALVYGVTLAALWIIAGRPRGAERLMIDRVVAWIGAARERVRPIG